MTKMSAVGSSCVVRHDVPLEQTHDDLPERGGKFCFSTPSSHFKCIISALIVHNECIMHNCR